MRLYTVSSEGRITLPAHLRRELGIKPHDRVAVDLIDGAIVVRRIPDLFELEGFLGKALPLDEERDKMMRGVAEHVLGSHE